MRRGGGSDHAVGRHGTRVTDDDNPFTAPGVPVAADACGAYEGRFREHRLRYWLEGDALHVDEGLLRIIVPLTHPEVRLIERRFGAPAGFIGLFLIAVAVVTWWLSARILVMPAVLLAAVGFFLALAGLGPRVAVGSRKRHIIIRVLDGDRVRFDAFVRQVRERVRPGG
jgi:hypothetical protein